jgi:phosphoribosylaminoimidazole-succinocarboxamide synthase
MRFNNISKGTQFMEMVKNVHLGKVRNSIILNNNTRIIQTSNRISAFDFVFPFEVEKKGEILQAISVWNFLKTSHIIENNLIGCLSNSHTLVKNAEVFPIEIIVRCYLTGSLWRMYSEHGALEVYKNFGIALPEGMAQNQKFSHPIITPAIKVQGSHDQPLSKHEAAKIVGKDNWEFICTKALELFHFGQRQAHSRNLILVDTKYEMGIFEDRIILVDEVHTPDSSRYWYAVDHNTTTPKQLSKEFLREEILSLFKNNIDNVLSNPTEHPFFQDSEQTKQLAQKITERYQELYQTLIGTISTQEIFHHCLADWPIPSHLFDEMILSATYPSKVLVIGNGGRDYSIYSSVAKLPEVNTVFCASGDRLWQSSKYSHCPYSQIQDIVHFAKDHNVGLVISGPELPIAQGIAEACSTYQIPVLAPSLACASLETSKIFSKEIMHAAGVLTPRSTTISWTHLKNALQQHLTEGSTTDLSLPCVIKYDGLAAGKGVFILQTVDDITCALHSIETNISEWAQLLNQLKTPSFSKIQGEPFFLIEELITGYELSVIALCNAEQFRLLPIAQDYKRRDDHQTGPNTGGMGTRAPIFVANSIMAQITATFSKTLKELSLRNMPYYGFLFAGFMIDKNQNAWLLEYNCRLGDPETQVILPGLQRDFYIECLRTSKKLPFLFQNKIQTPFDHDQLKRVFVVGAAPEYPFTTPERREVILPSAHEIEKLNCELIPSAIETDKTTTGGRILGVLSAHSSFSNARNNAYQIMNSVKLKNNFGDEISPHFRTDIGLEFDNNN